VFDAMSLEDRTILELEVIVPDWFNRARRCRSCGHVRLCEVTEAGLVYDPICPSCGGRQSRAVQSKTAVIADAMTKFKRAKYDKIKRDAQAGDVSLWKLWRARGLKRPVDRRYVPTMIREALDRWRRALKAKGLCP
jgi:hypothetical protein